MINDFVSDHDGTQFGFMEDIMKKNGSTYIVSGSSKTETTRFLGLLWALVARELKGRYRRSLLGPGWAILQPLIYMVVFTFLRGVLDISSEGVPYVIFTFSALVPWTFFSNAVIRCGPSIASNASVLKKIAISREVFPLAGVVASFVDFVIASLILAVIMFWYKVPVGMSIFLLPILVAMSGLLAMGIGLGVSALGTYKHDIIFVMPFLMQLWLLTTPIMYPLGNVPERWQFLYQLNPMVGIIESFRFIIIKGTIPDMSLLLLPFAGIALAWAVGWPLFRYMSQYFADVL
jgi:lipopolysaccharide transport system permease protein